MNIKEIARKAGVSVATVSRVLNHPDRVAEETRNKIQEIMRESDYSPNWFAQSLNFHRTGTIGLLIPNILNPGYTEIAKGVEDVAHQKNYTTLLCNGEEDAAKERNYIDTLIRRQVDGIVLVSSNLERKDIEHIRRQGIPVIQIGEDRGDHDIPTVRIDCAGASEKAVRHFLESGKTRIAFVQGVKPELENKRKLMGYRKAMKASGCIVMAGYIQETENSIEGGYIAGKRLLSLDPAPDAIFASSDILAFGVMEALKDNDVQIPEDVGVIGFDNIRMSSLIEPRLTTVAKPMHKMGLVGARLLFDLMESEDQEMPANREILLQSKLKIRKSCGNLEQIDEIF